MCENFKVVEAKLINWNIVLLAWAAGMCMAAAIFWAVEDRVPTITRDVTTEVVELLVIRLDEKDQKIDRIMKSVDSLRLLYEDCLKNHGGK